MTTHSHDNAVAVAAVQMTSGPDVNANLESAGALLAQAAREGARVALLPENFAFMGLRDVDKRAVAERNGEGPIQDFLSRRARELKLWIIAGTMPISEVAGERVAAACLVYDDAGQRVARYDKIHLFDVDIPGRDEKYRESAHIVPGSRAVLVPTPAGLLGLSVCYDLRFPELYRPLSAAGAQWFTVPSAFTVPTGRAHWEMLLRARAIENLGFVVAAGQWGRHASGRETYGDSIIIDYWGTVLARLSAGQGVVVATLDLAAQQLARRDFPALSHRVL
ncbi:MAG TPA: carbon-nitrogen hydrolase family protein [Steroidobacteraceae bacterium]